MNERVNARDSGWKTFIVGAALLALIGAWSAFVVWHADKAPVPAPAVSLSDGAVESGDAEVARRIIVYVTGANGTTEQVIEESEGQSSVG